MNTENLQVGDKVGVYKQSPSHRMLDRHSTTGVKILEVERVLKNGVVVGGIRFTKYGEEYGASQGWSSTRSQLCTLERANEMLARDAETLARKQTKEDLIVRLQEVILAEINSHTKMNWNGSDEDVAHRMENPLSDTVENQVKELMRKIDSRVIYNLPE